MGIKLKWICPSVGSFKSDNVGVIAGDTAEAIDDLALILVRNKSFESPTIHPSILVNRGGANPTAHICHSYVTEGKIQYLGDCTHAFAGRTIELPDWWEDEANRP